MWSHRSGHEHLVSRADTRGVHERSESEVANTISNFSTGAFGKPTHQSVDLRDRGQQLSSSREMTGATSASSDDGPLLSQRTLGALSLRNLLSVRTPTSGSAHSVAQIFNLFFKRIVPFRATHRCAKLQHGNGEIVGF